MSVSVVVLGRDEHLVRQIEGYRGELIVVRVCDDAAEAIAACAASAADVLLVSERGLMPPMEQVDQLTGQRTVVALLDPKPGRTTIVPGLVEIQDTVGMVELEALITRALGSLGGAAEGRGAGSSAAPEEGAGREGRIVCFWGAPGSPGRSTVALNYAVEAAVAGLSVVLVDADTYAAALAIQLGLMDESASIAQMCRVVDSGSRDPARLRATCLAVEVADSTLMVATGIPRASRWPEVRAAALRRAALTLRSHHDLVVLDVAPYIELDEQLSFDTQAPQRNAVTVEMLQCADDVFMVVAADSLGIPRALRAIDELEDKVPGIEPQIIFNKVSSGNSGHSPKRRVLEAWQRFGPTHPVVGFLPRVQKVA
ncbi:chromosome partitioning protein [Glutamicibacter protophormiae]|uniref:chromosome partitioning protein n=1 Tax=Glutamicibacter protophormiae TaxID=37930 RepID=UPI003A93F94D